MTTSTETASQAYRDIERFSTLDMLGAMLTGQRAAVDAVTAALPALEQAVEAAAQRLANSDSRLIYVGAGTSGRVAMLDAVELYPTFGWPEERSLFLLAGGSISVAEARESAEDDEVAGCDEATARAALEQTDFHVKPAVLVVRGLSPEEARAALDRNSDDLHRTIATLG